MSCCIDFCLPYWGVCPLEKRKCACYGSCFSLFVQSCPSPNLIALWIIQTMVMSLWGISRASLIVVQCSTTERGRDWIQRQRLNDRGALGGVRITWFFFLPPLPPHTASDFAEGPVPACAVSQSSTIKGLSEKTRKGDVRKRRGCKPLLAPAPWHSPQPTEGMPLRSTLRSSFISTSGPSTRVSRLPIWGRGLLALVISSATTFCWSCGTWVHSLCHRN